MSTTQGVRGSRLLAAATAGTVGLGSVIAVQVLAAGDERTVAVQQAARDEAAVPRSGPVTVEDSGAAASPTPLERPAAQVRARIENARVTFPYLGEELGPDAAPVLDAVAADLLSVPGTGVSLYIEPHLPQSQERYDRRAARLRCVTDDLVRRGVPAELVSFDLDAAAPARVAGTLPNHREVVFTVVPPAR